MLRQLRKQNKKGNSYIPGGFSNEMNLLKYCCLLMADINVQYETAVYLNEVLDSYKLISEEDTNNKFIEILM